ncbi:hypothetical protein Tco_1303827 [Tanacetum coccineum]
MDSVIPLGQKNILAEYMILSRADNRPPMLDKDLYDSWKSRMELYMQNKDHGRMILESVENGPLIWPTVEENGVIRTKKYDELSAAECDIKATNIILQGLPADIYSLLHAYLKQHELYTNKVCLLRERNQDPLASVANQQMTPPQFNTYQSSYDNPQLQQNDGDGWEMMVRGRGGVAVEGGDEVEMVGDGVAVVGGVGVIEEMKVTMMLVWCGGDDDDDGIVWRWWRWRRGRGEWGELAGDQEDVSKHFYSSSLHFDELDHYQLYNLNFKLPFFISNTANPTKLAL